MGSCPSSNDSSGTDQVRWTWGRHCGWTGWVPTPRPVGSGHGRDSPRVPRGLRTGGGRTGTMLYLLPRFSPPVPGVLLDPGYRRRRGRKETRVGSWGVPEGTGSEDVTGSPGRPWGPLPEPVGVGTSVVPVPHPFSECPDDGAEAHVGRPPKFQGHQAPKVRVPGAPPDPVPCSLPRPFLTRPS